MRNLLETIIKARGEYFSRLLVFAFLLFVGQLAYAQRQAVTGVVKTESGETLAGVSISEKGTFNGTISDINGRYNIVVASEASIEIRFLGFQTQSIKVEGRANIDIVLKEDFVALETVVVVGYGQQKKESVIGAISSVGTGELLKSSSPNITQAIAGKLPGVMTVQSSGAPGADNAAIFIRGRASFAGDNQPLIMVDGVEREFSQIAPDDIETISVLKDASATAVYGVRGANGVILVTTKRGNDNKPQVSFTANYQWQTPTRGDNYLDSYNSVVLLEEALANDNLASQYSANDIDMFRKSVRGELTLQQQQLYPNVDWYDEILKNSAPAQRYNVNIQGGTKKMRYFTSLEYYNQGGLYKDNNNYDYGKSANVSFNRYSFRANLDFLITRHFTASVNFGTRFEERKGPNIVDNNAVNEVFYELNHSPGWLFPVRYENGFYGGNSQNQNNIAAKLANGGFYQTVRTINETNFILKHDFDFITKGLSAKAMASFDYDTNYDRRFRAGFATYELIDRENPGLTSSYTRFGEDGELTYVGNVQTTSMKTYLEFSFDYARIFNDVHEVSALLLYNQNDYRFQADLSKRYQGVVGRVTYNYQRKYFGEFNAGFNGSENFAKGNRFGFFPSMSVGWMLSNEEFMEPAGKWLDAFKIRASYGEVGNDVFKRNNTDVRFLYLDSWTQLNNAYTFGTNNSQPGIFEGQYPNYLVTWERARKYNFGIESGFLRGLLAVNIDVFKEDRENILTDYLTKPGWLAVSMAPGNLGKSKNQGFEVVLGHKHKINKFNYNVNANFTHAKNEIIERDEPPGMTGYLKREGQPINQFYGLISEGFITQADINSGSLPQSTFGIVKPGDLKYRDMNKDGFIDDRDATFIGYSDIPENVYSLTLGAEYNGWGLSIMFQGANKVSRFYDSESMFAFVNGGKVKEHHLLRWNPSRTEAENLSKAKYPLLHYDQNGLHNQLRNSFFLQNGDYLRLKNVELSYIIPGRISKRWHMNHVRLYVNANNLITWDKLDIEIDPETTGSNLYPIMKSVNMGVNIRF